MGSIWANIINMRKRDGGTHRRGENGLNATRLFGGENPTAWSSMSTGPSMSIRKGQGRGTTIRLLLEAPYVPIFPYRSSAQFRHLKIPPGPGLEAHKHTAFPVNFAVTPFPGILTPLPKSKMRACVGGETLTLIARLSAH